MDNPKLNVVDLYNNPFPLMWSQDGEEWFHYLNKFMTQKYNSTGWGAGSSSPDKNFPYPYTAISINGSDKITTKLRMVLLRDNHGVYFFLSSDKKISNDEIGRWKQAIEYAHKNTGQNAQEHEWFSVIKPGFSIEHKVYKLRSQSKIGQLTLRSGGKRYVEYTESSPPHFGSLSINNSWPIIVSGNSKGYSWDIASRKASKDVHVACVLLSLAWSQLWEVAQVPINSKSSNVSIPSSNRMLENEIKHIGVKAQQKSAPKWLNSAFEMLFKSEELMHALNAYYEGLRLQNKHPSFAFIAYIASIESIGRLLLGTTCKCCGSNPGPKHKFSAGVRAVIKDNSKAKEIINKYSSRNDTAHQGKLHGHETFPGIFFPNIFNQAPSPLLFAYDDVRKMSDTANKLLVSTLRGKINIVPN